jgi:hypothetical protein
MANPERSRGSEGSNEFLQKSQGGSDNLFSEMFGFLRHSKKWWLMPIVLGLVLVGILIVLGGTAVAPFIYATF